MAKRKKKRKRKSRYSEKMVPVETTEQMLKKFPDKLVKTFVKLKLSKFAEKEHQAYVKLANKFLGKLKDDRIAQGTLIVQLSRATAKMVKDTEKQTKEKSISHN